jgi:hypothetical protein
MSALRSSTVAVGLVIGLASPVFAQTAGGYSPLRVSAIELAIWGISYHIDRSRGYNENNWGVGLRYSGKPDWRWLGRKPATRLFLEVDVLTNSYKGLVLPASFGLEYDAASVGPHCSLLMTAAFTTAYYQKPERDRPELRYGPVPSFAVGCGRWRMNVAVLFSPSRRILDGFVGFLRVGL